MFVLSKIEVLADDLQNLADDVLHKMTFTAVFTIKDVPDTFTGVVIEDVDGNLQLLHFNSTRGNKRKVITLKNKLAQGSFEQIKQTLFAKARGETISLPQQVDIVDKRVSSTPRAGLLKK